MNTGHVISGAGHIGLIGWLFFGANFAPTPEPFEVNEGAVISSAEFEALLAGTTPPEAVTDMVLPVPPEPVPPPPVRPPVRSPADTRVGPPPG
ncbi:MAG: energy transducer TonB, partial [Lutimaribacter sp.]